MDYLSFREYFNRIFEKNGLEIYSTDENIRKFYDLTIKMVETNKVMNITALTTMDKIIPLHYADCVKAAALIPQNATVADIGCGGGFPILPLSIVRPDLKLVGIDSTEKKIRYVQNTADELGLSVTAISGRAEDLAKQTDYRDYFDVVISRAVARLNILDELCMPFVKVGGTWIAMKGPNEPIKPALQAIRMLGGSLEDTISYQQPGGDARVIYVVKKISQTPTKYPRNSAQIKKKTAADSDDTIVTVWSGDGGGQAVWEELVDEWNATEGDKKNVYIQWDTVMDATQHDVAQQSGQLPELVGLSGTRIKKFQKLFYQKKKNL